MLDRRALVFLALLVALPGAAQEPGSNSPPTVASVRLVPGGATIRTTLECVAKEVADADGDEVQLAYAWTVAGEVVEGADSSTLEMAPFHKGQRVTCQVTPSDGQAQGEPVSSRGVTIQNSPPKLEGVELSPPRPGVTEEVRCEAIEPSDADGDKITVLVRWLVDGAAVSTSRTLDPSHTAKGQTLQCEATPSDGKARGNTVSSPVAKVTSTPPVLASASLGPSAPTGAQDLHCQAGEASDADGDEVSLAYAWFVDGQALEGAHGDTLSAERTRKGQAIACEITPSDGEVSGQPVRTEALTVVNTPPTLGAPSITPEVAKVDSTLQCKPGQATDADGDEVELCYAWTVAGRSVAVEGPSLEPTHFRKNQAIICRITPFDGEVEGETVQAGPVTIGNTPPVMGAVSIDDTAPSTADSLRCEVGETSDEDGDKVRLSYRWLADGKAVSTSQTLSSSLTRRGQSLVCEVTASDGATTLPPVQSAAVTVQNSPPSLASVSLSPASPTGSQDLVCKPGTATDADRDEVSLATTWLVDGKPLAGADGSTLTADKTRKGQAIACQVTPSDGDASGEAVRSEAVTVVNSLPTVASATLSPAQATIASTLKCEAGETADMDGDQVQLRYAWTVAGRGVEATGQTLDKQHFRRGQSVSCAVTPYDGEAEGRAARSSALTIGNTAPVGSSAEISPASPLTTDTLECQPGEGTDIDGEKVSYLYRWLVDDKPAGSASTLSSAYTKKGQSIRCEVTPTDGSARGEPVGSAAVTVKNSPPSLASVTVSPARPTGAQDLSCKPGTTTDADRDQVSLATTWLVDGKPLAGADGATLSADKTRKGQAIACQVTPSDGDASGEAVRSEAVTVVNSLPTVASATLSPAQATISTTLKCEAGDTADMDGDEVKLRYAWTVAGRVVEATGQTLDEQHFRRGQAVSCAVTPFDGEAEGRAARSSAVTIGNTPPVGSSAKVTPASPLTNDTLECEAGDGTDVDGDQVSFLYRWLVDDEPAGSASTLSSAYTKKGQSVRCEVTPTDGSARGEPVASAPVTVQNTPPTVGAVRITPASALTTDTLRCVPSGARDADGDAITWSYAWTVDGKAVEGDEQLQPKHFAKGQEVRCTATPRDDTAAGEGVQSEPPVIRNSPPVITAVSLQPALVRTGDAIKALVTTEDADGDTVELEYAWTVSGRPAEARSDTLPPEATAKGQRVAVRVSATDGTASGRPVTSSSLTIANTPPETPVVIVGDSLGGYKDLVCHTLMDVEDVDGDRVSYRYSWTVDGKPWTGPTSNTRRPGDTILPAHTGSDQQWECTVRASDGQDTSPPGSQAVLLLEPRVNAGSGNTCGLRTNGEPYCWGTNENHASNPVQGTFRRISTGSWHSCVLDVQGHIQCWGHDRHGQATPPKEGGFVQISAGAFHTCALDAQGQVSCWGQDVFGQASPPAERFSQVASGWKHSCGVLTSGEVRCWGNNVSDQAAPPAGRFSQVTVGEKHSCGLRKDGRIVCWGEDTVQQLQAPSGSFTLVQAGELHTCALATDATLHCWGMNNYGQTEAPEGRYLWLSKGSTHQCALDEDAQFRCWGRDNFNQTEVPAAP